MSTEYNDNRISLYVAQQGKCSVTNEILEIGSMEIHHKIPKKMGGKDKYDNLIFVTANIHKLIHANTPEVIEKYLQQCKEVKINLKLLNQLRKLVGNCKILVNK
ncbi:HNH endonuclease signature motif containing protein [Clostridium tyrobutyricum]|uniref:HNH endonuclease signature motif containing protein n=1 Tax=Clostridium tyrobutyricum TaxID=1519 RepID=UPI001C395B1E|nr:HNH endonuclease signature motif containing protein [Clostridium tyrobutyricum]MBV4416476.1 HNH endonuclease [Clostridium tyrobutyricum]MEA5007184.1 HNH endonuclease signature motif containing protein [Clostridium tyrobutyricum]